MSEDKTVVEPDDAEPAVVHEAVVNEDAVDANSEPDGDEGDPRPERFDVPLERKLEIGLETAKTAMELLGLKVESLDGSLDGDHVILQVGPVVGPQGAVLEGRVWESLQFILNKAINRNALRRTRLRLETDGFRGRRGDKLGKIAQTLARKVVTLRRSVTIGPMDPGEVRQLTSQLHRAGGVSVTTIGDDARKLVIKPGGSSPRSGSGNGSGGSRRRRRRR